jgi:transposase
VPGVPGVPSAEELSALPAAELTARLAEAYRVIGELTAQVERLSAEVEDLRRRAGRDSSTSSRPPSSDSPYKKGRDRSSQERGKRRPGKQPGDPGTTMLLVDVPDERLEFPPAACRGRGAGLAAEPVAAQRRHQVTDIEPTPPPKVTEYVAQAEQRPCCGTVTAGELPAHVRARARRLRLRPVLPVHRRQMGHQQTRRPPRPVQRPCMDAPRPRTRRITRFRCPCYLNPPTLAE